jgi:hypothetical protein
MKRIIGIGVEVDGSDRVGNVGGKLKKFSHKDEKEPAL